MRGNNELLLSEWAGR